MKNVPFPRFRRIAAIIILVFSTGILLWGYWPTGRSSQALSLYAGDMQIPSAGELSPEILESRRLTFEWTRRIRKGDTALVRLILAKVEQENEPASPQPPDQPFGESNQIPDIYISHSVMTEARLDMSGIQDYPSDQVSQSLLPRETVTFTWRLKPERSGLSRGTVWTYLEFLPRDGGEGFQLPIYSQVVEIPVISLFGLTGPSARVIGVIGFLIGFLLIFDRVLARIWKRVSIHPAF